MKAPWCLRWRFSLARDREPRRATCPLELSAGLLLGSFCVLLFVTVTSVNAGFTDKNCPVRRDAPDAASRAIVSPQVVQAVVGKKVPVSVSSYQATFRVIKVHKKYRGARRLKRRRLVTLTFRNPSYEPVTSDCLVPALLRPHKKYFLFVSGASTRKEDLYPIASPIPVTKHTKKRVRGVMCKECEAKPTVGPLRQNSVVRGHNVNMTCYFDGNPIPKVIWTKDSRRIRSRKRNGMKIYTKIHEFRRKPKRPSRRFRNMTQSATHKKRHQNSKKRKRRRKSPKTKLRIFSTLEIKSARDSHAGSYECMGRSVLGETSADAYLSVVPPLDPGIVYPCPYDSYCLNGGTCMFFKIFGELVCQCAEGYKGRRCEEKSVFVDAPVVNCRGPNAFSRQSKGVRCPRNQPLEIWEILQESLKMHRRIPSWREEANKQRLPTTSTTTSSNEHEEQSRLEMLGWIPNYDDIDDDIQFYEEDRISSISSRRFDKSKQDVSFSIPRNILSNSPTDMTYYETSTNNVSYSPIKRRTFGKALFRN